MGARPSPELEVGVDVDLGPLDPHIPAFVSLLSSQGYSAGTIRSNLQVIRNFNKWLAARQVKLQELHEASLGRFFKEHPMAGYVRRGGFSSLRRLLEYLRRAGVTPLAPREIDDSVLRRVENDFARHLAEERGLSQATLCNYLAIRPLLPR